MRVRLAEQDRLRITVVDLSGDDPAAQPLNLLPQGRPFVHQTHELGVHPAEELPDGRFLVATSTQS